MKNLPMVNRICVSISILKPKVKCASELAALELFPKNGCVVRTKGGQVEDHLSNTGVVL